MKGFKKRISAFILGAALTIPAFLSLSLLIRIELNHLRLERQMEKEYSQTIRVSSHSFTWIREGKEILIEGRWFDVHSFRKEGNEIVFTGLYDEKEKEWMQKLHDNSSSDRKNHSAVSLLLLIPFAYHPLPPEFRYPSIADALTHNNSEDSLPELILQVPTPPPDIFRRRSVS